MLDASGSRLFILFAGTFLVARVSSDDYLPVVINTWPFVDANKWGERRDGWTDIDAYMFLVYQARPSLTLQKSERRSSRCYYYA